MAPAVAELPALERLSLGYNNISGALSCLAIASARTRLRALDVAENRLQGSIPGCLLQTGNLRELYLAGNQLSGALPGLMPQSPLVELSLENQVWHGAAGWLQRYSVVCPPPPARLLWGGGAPSACMASVWGLWTARRTCGMDGVQRRRG